MGVLTMIKKMPRDRAAIALEPYDLSPEDRENYLKLAKEVKPAAGPKQNVSFDPHRRTWLGAAYLLGGSLRQLGTMHEVSPQSIALSVNRVMTKEIRAAQRLAMGLSYEKLELYRVSYEANAVHLKYLEPLAVAEWLRDNTSLED